MTKRDIKTDRPVLDERAIDEALSFGSDPYGNDPFDDYLRARSVRPSRQQDLFEEDEPHQVQARRRRPTMSQALDGELLPPLPPAGKALVFGPLKGPRPKVSGSVFEGAARPKGPRFSDEEFYGAPKSKIKGITPDKFHWSLERQPDGQTCGPTCIRMAMNHLGLMSGVKIKTIAGMCGTNGQTGTTDKAMEKGLEEIGLTWRKTEARSPEDLRTLLGAGNMVILRTAIPVRQLRPGENPDSLPPYFMVKNGTVGAKHWVLAYGATETGFLIADPAGGSSVWTDPHLDACWGARDYDAYEIPSNPDLHPRAWDKQDRLEAQHIQRQPYEMTADEFIGDHPVIKNGRWSAWHYRMVDDVQEACERAVMDHKAGVAALRPLDYRWPDKEGLRGFKVWLTPRRSFMRGLIITTDPEVVGQDGNPQKMVAVAGIHMGTRWVHKDWQTYPVMREDGQVERVRRGLGTELVLAAFAAPGRPMLKPSQYSEAGRRSREKAHYESIRRALEAGIEVSPRVLQDYPDLQPTTSVDPDPDTGGNDDLSP